MSSDIRMPKLSDSMEEGTVIRWMVAVGQSITAGDVIAEVETDKANVEIEAETSGVISEIVVAEGATAAVGAVIATLAGAADAAAKAAAAPPADGGKTTAAPVTATAAAPAPVTAEPPPAPAVAGTAKTTSVARRLAQQHGIDLGALRGSGPGGRIVKRDVEGAMAQAAPSSAATAPASDVSDGETMSRMRRTIAARMEKAKREIPHFYLRTEVDAGEMMRIYRASRAGDVWPGLTLTHLLVRAIGVTLPEHRRLNALWVDDSIQMVDDVNVGVVVALEDGLLVPVLKQVQTLGIRAIVNDTRALVERARSGRLQAGDLVGGTISVSNIGMLDVDELTPIINEPQAAVLGVGTVRERAIARDGRLSVGETMNLTLACDHRVVNGVEAGRFLEALKHVLEQPLALVAEPA